MMMLPLVAVGLLWFLLSRTSSATRLMRSLAPGWPEKASSIALVVVALVVLARGNVWAALFLFGISLWLLGRAGKGRHPAPAGAAPRWRSRLIEMERDAASGRLGGRIVSGPAAGTPLDALDREDCLRLLAACRQADPDGVGLLEPYLDGRFPGWRTAEHVHRNAGERRARFTSHMSEDEAYQVLGLARGASRDEIVRSHRAVMKKWHPDQGGTADLAARANEAKEVLLRRHA